MSKAAVSKPVVHTTVSKSALSKPVVHILDENQDEVQALVLAMVCILLLSKSGSGDCLYAYSSI